MFADRTILPPFPTLPAPSTLSPWAIASGCHGNKIFPSQPRPLVLRVTHQNTPTFVRPGPTLDFPSLPNDSNHPGRLRKETQFLSLAFFYGKNCLRVRGLQDSPPSQQQVAQGSITYTFRVRGRSRRSA